VNSKEAAIGEGVEGAAEVSGVRDGEDIMDSEKVNSGLVDVDVDEREVGRVWHGES